MWLCDVLGDSSLFLCSAGKPGCRSGAPRPSVSPGQGRVGAKLLVFVAHDGSILPWSPIINSTAGDETVHQPLLSFLPLWGMRRRSQRQVDPPICYSWLLIYLFLRFFFVIRFSCIYNILSADWKSTSQTPATAARSPSGSVIFTTTWTSAWESQSLTAPAWTRGGRMAGKTAPVTEWAEGCWDAAAMKGTLKKNHHYQSANLLRGFFCDSCSWNT